MVQKMCLAMDMGGTKTSWQLMDAQGVAALTGWWPTADLFPQNLAQRLEEALSDRIHDLRGVGVSVAAAVRGTTVWFAPNLAHWEGIDFADVLRTWKVPVSVIYDGHAALLGQRWHDRGLWNNAIMIVIGTGIGGGIFSGGHLLAGEHNLAGVFGALRFQGRSLEEWASGPGIASACGVRSGIDALALYHQGDAKAVRAFNRAARILRAAISALTGTLDIGTVFVGGGMGVGAFPVLFPKGSLSNKAMIHVVTQGNVRILKAFSSDAALYGSVQHWLR